MRVFSKFSSGRSSVKYPALSRTLTQSNSSAVVWMLRRMLSQFQGSNGDVNSDLLSRPYITVVTGLQ